jgi:predicted P-loop ATPase
MTPKVKQATAKVVAFPNNRKVRRVASSKSAGGARNWQNGLMLNGSDRPRPNFSNGLHAFRYAPDLFGLAGFNEFDGQVYVLRRPPWDKGSGPWVQRPWTDNDDRLLTEWLQRQDIQVTDGVAIQVVQTVAREHPFHPIRAELESLQWDGIERLDEMGPRYFGAVDTEYTRAVFRRAMIAAVARVYRPGCKVDNLLVLEGGQGSGKSTAVRTLSYPYYTDRLSDIASKDAAQELFGVWFVEIPEFDALRRADANAIKAFITRLSDRYRPPYGRRVETIERQCVFVATVNPDGAGYLKDPTGARRFWPVLCGKVDVEALKADRDMLWAEARDLFHTGHPWWLETPELEELARAEQVERSQVDPWMAHILEHIDGKTETSVREVLEHLNKDEGNWTTGDEIRVGRILSQLGFERIRKTLADGARPYAYRRLQSQNP